MVLLEAIHLGFIAPSDIVEVIYFALVFEHNVCVHKVLTFGLFVAVAAERATGSPAGALGLSIGVVGAFGVYPR